MDNNSQKKSKIAVIGGGAWGTALAQVCARAGQETLIWARESEVVAAINVKHENPTFLKGVPLHEDLKATDDLDYAVGWADVVLNVTPTQFFRSILESVKHHFMDGKPLVICSKGVELDTGLLLSHVAKQVVPNITMAVLTGPTFAREVAMGMPSAVTIGAEDLDVAKDLQAVLGEARFRPYTSDDLIGTQLGGAIKNVIAIACGIVYGRQMGENARAALLTRGVAEIARLGEAMDAKKETLLGMCGIGDLMLTCSSVQSRNFSLGKALGEGKTLDEILGPRKAVTEGVYTAKSTLQLARQYAVDMPITEAVNGCLNEGVSIDQAIEDMINRPFRY
jgi:glycerol-3-phosphate dehydrogenase (NAD(P)+)